ncbi:MAG: ABC transporter permease [bacterium]
MRRSTIWAFARNTIAQAIRIRVAFVIMGIYLVVVPALAFVVEGDGTLHGLLRVVITYDFIVAGFLLGVLTLALSTTTLWNELREKQIFLIESRPVRRWEVLVGKLLGILAIDAALLVFMGVVTWGSVRVLMAQPRWEEEEGGYAREIAREQVLTARHVVEPQEPKLEKQVDRIYERLEEERSPVLRGRTEGEVKEAIREQLRAALTTLVPLGQVTYYHRAKGGEFNIPFAPGHVWRFQGLPTEDREELMITLRFKFLAPDAGPEEGILVAWLIGKQSEPERQLRFTREYTPEEEHEVTLPATPISDDGVLEVHLLNIDHLKAQAKGRAPRVIVFSDHDAMKVLLPVGGFAMNLARGLGLLFVEVLFLAILGLFCSTFLTFPVSPIVALCLLLLIYLAGAVHGELERGLELGTERQEGKVSLRERAVRVITAAVRVVLPPFDRYSPASRVSQGIAVSWPLILEAVGLVALVRGGLLVFFGALIFQHRELALAAR